MRRRYSTRTRICSRQTLAGAGRDSLGKRGGWEAGCIWPCPTSGRSGNCSGCGTSGTAKGSFLTKAMLVHRAKWGSRSDVLEQLYGPRGQGQHSARRDNIARLLGYGFPDVEEAVSCTPHRATLLGYGTISAKEAKVHRIPLPPSLERITEPRKVTVTVAWLSPVNLRHQSYRRAKLEAGAVTNLEAAAGVKRSSGQPPRASASRGTVFHDRYEGKNAVSFVDDGHVLLRIFCREQAGVLDQPIRYGAAVTIEAGEGIAVYDEIRTRLGVPITPPAS